MNGVPLYSRVTATYPGEKPKRGTSLIYKKRSAQETRCSLRWRIAPEGIGELILSRMTAP